MTTKEALQAAKKLMVELGSSENINDWKAIVEIAKMLREDKK